MKKKKKKTNDDENNFSKILQVVQLKKIGSNKFL